eukprot:g17668.t1
MEATAFESNPCATGDFMLFRPAAPSGHGLQWHCQAEAEADFGAFRWRAFAPGGGPRDHAVVTSIKSTRRQPTAPPSARGREQQEIVTFLASVPLFKTQLPRSELPKVAQKLKRKEWQRGQDIVKQGDLGKAFYLIMSGEAEVFTQSEDEPGIVRAVLRKGDYWGGRSLMEERNNVATILVTLSMSRKAFHDSGISQLLRFPKRAAIHNELPAASSSDPWAEKARTPLHLERSPQETLFISQAVRRNANLRALLHMTEEQLDQIVASAQRMEVKKDEEVACFGEVGDKFFILFEGSVDVVARHWA